jgi:hypothetical protein
MQSCTNVVEQNILRRGSIFNEAGLAHDPAQEIEMGRRQRQMAPRALVPAETKVPAPLPKRCVHKVLAASILIGSNTKALLSGSGDRIEIQLPGSRSARGSKTFVRILRANAPDTTSDARPRAAIQPATERRTCNRRRRRKIWRGGDFSSSPVCEGAARENFSERLASHRTWRCSSCRDRR